IKAFLTDYGFESTNLALQVFGGHGYIVEHGMEQFVRDARISQIYEGANGIQALDLVGRKLSQHSGRLMRQFFPVIDQFVRDHKENPGMADFIQPLADGLSKLQQATMYVAQKGMMDKEEAGAAASDYCRLFGYVALAHMWAKMAKVSLEKMNGENPDFYRNKLSTARFYMSRMMPNCGALLTSIQAGKKSIMELSEAAF
ncbi:MAG: acyl-CoA dehydrogenase, partial [Alphaproteobacteria bacterium]|nr:acyl-CoA dehydrogenase [Alphaproteobacteria bacterium]